MANPQQPERRRSEQVPALSPDAMAAELEVEKDQRARSMDQADRESLPDEEFGAKGGAECSEDQDQPDLDEFADRFGVTSDAAMSTEDE